MTKFIALLTLIAIAGCSSTGRYTGNAYTDYRADSFTVGVNHCLHNTVLPCMGSY